tara:strand:- start:723 stop:1139 length:417 start_codon:yes stop_codon:yes gene_type:complete
VIKKQKNSQTDLETWKEFINNPSDIYDKEDNNLIKQSNKCFKFDLHGFSLLDANKKVEELIFYCVNKGYKEILLITGKGIHSNTDADVYSSKDLSKLKYSVPEFIKSNREISPYVLKIFSAKKNQGGDGAIIIKLKNL